MLSTVSVMQGGKHLMEKILTECQEQKERVRNKEEKPYLQFVMIDPAAVVVVVVVAAAVKEFVW